MFKALSIGIAAVAAVMLLLGQGPRPAEAATTVYVTTNNNAGPGSFRAAVDQANSNPNIGTIKFLVSGPITLQTAVIYTSGQPLTLSALARTVIQGSTNWPFSVTCASSGDASASCIPPCEDGGLFTSTSAADLTFLSLTFQDATCGSGIRVRVPAVDRTVNITLTSVVLKDNDAFGIWVTEDRDFTCDQSDADINLNLWYSTASGNASGVRVSEYGPGDLTTSIRFSSLGNNHDGDGIGLDEDCDGDVTLNTAASSFTDNEGAGIEVDEVDGGGITASLAGLDASNNGSDGVRIDENDAPVIPPSVDTADDEADDDANEGAVSEGPGAATCVSGGSLTVTATGGRASGNRSDGFHIEENDCGSVQGTFNAVIASWNGQDGIELDENGGGDLSFTAGSATTTEHNGQDADFGPSGDGIDLDEDDYGDFTADLTSIASRFNGTGGDDVFNDGIDASEDGQGSFKLTAKLSIILSNSDDGAFLLEGDCGNLDATFVSSTVSANADDGIDAEQDDCGGDEGELTLVFTSVVANGDNNLELDGVVLN